MNGDFSRFAFDPKRRYAAVLMQQGRVLLDADWNEQAAMAAHRMRAGTEDVVGPTGAPDASPGFRIRARRGLAFGGSDGYVRVSNAAPLAFGNRSPFTLEAWVNPSAQRPGGAIVSTLAGSSNSSAAQSVYLLEVEPAGTAAFSRVVAGPSTGRQGAAGLQVVRTLRPLTPGRFTLVAAVFNGALGRLYLDGEQAGEAVWNGNGVSGDVPLLMGASNTGQRPGRFFDGVIEAVRVWALARTPQQERGALYDDPSQSEKGLAAYWPLDEGTGVQARDASGNGCDGTFDASTDAVRPQWAAPTLWIGPGRFYVNGVLCEGGQEVSFTAQPDLPGAGLPSSGDYLAYLDVWERGITAVEDPSIRETALGGPDTSARVRTIQQVKLRSAEQGRDGERARRGDWARNDGRKGAMRARRVDTAASVGNHLYRVEVHEKGGLYGWPRPAVPATDEVPVHGLSAEARTVQVAGWMPDAIDWDVGQLVELFSDDTDARAQAGAIGRVEEVDKTSGTLTLDTVPADMADHGNIRVRHLASYKWSRDNASLAFPLTRVDAAARTLTLGHVGPDTIALREGDWVELADEDSVLLNRRGRLCQVESVDRVYFA